MKRIIVVAILVGTLGMNSTKIKAQTIIEQRLEQLRHAMIKPETDKLNDLVWESLSYGHSNGFVEKKEEFISSLVSGKYKFLSIDISEQHIDVTDNIAIVRHYLYAVTHDKDKPEGTVKLKVLLVWKKLKDNKWVLLARQAVKA